MTIRPTVVVGYDGSDAARQALVRAAQLVRPGERVTVVAAAPLLVHLRDAPEDDEGTPLPDVLLAQAEEWLRGLGAETDVIAAPLEPADALVEAAREVGAGIVIVGTRGRGRAARTALGSVSTAVLHHAPCDVLVVRPVPGAGGADLGRPWPAMIVVGFDASPSARLALEDAAELVRPGGEIDLVFVADRGRRGRRTAARTALGEACELLAGRGLTARAIEMRGEPAAAIVEAAREREADLVAVGSRSRGPLSRLVLGSVSTAVVTRAEQDVLVVRRR